MFTEFCKKRVMTLYRLHSLSEVEILSAFTSDNLKDLVSVRLITEHSYSILIKNKTSRPDNHHSNPEIKHYRNVLVTSSAMHATQIDG